MSTYTKRLKLTYLDNTANFKGKPIIIAQCSLNIVWLLKYIEKVEYSMLCVTLVCILREIINMSGVGIDQWSVGLMIERSWVWVLAGAAG